MRKKAPTIYDIARRSGVSVSTVSRVLNGRHTVNPDMRARVEQSMRELRFRPNRVAQNLYHRHSNTLGCILPDISSPYFAQLFQELEQYAFELGYTIILGNTTSKPELETTYLHNLAERQVDGLLFLGGRANQANASPDDLHDIQEIAERLPIVVVNGDLPGVDILASVSSDEASGARALLRHLREHGHTDIAFLGGRLDVTSTLAKLAVYREFCPAAPPEWLHTTGLTVQAGELALEQLLAAPRQPTAALCVNDMTAAGALVTARRHGLQVPADLSIVGFDDVFVAQIVAPALTTVNHNYTELARAAIDVLLAGMAGEQPARTIQIPPRLVLRDTVAHAKAGARPPLNPGRRGGAPGTKRRS